MFGRLRKSSGCLIQTDPLPGRLSISLKDDPIAAPVLLQFLTAARCFAKPCRVQATVVGTGARLFKSNKSEHTDTGISDGWIAMVTDLAAVQEKVGQPILIPDRNFSHDEIATISFLRVLLHEPIYEATWTHLNLTWSAEDAIEALQQFTQAETYKFEGKEFVVQELFGSQLPLGPVQFMVEAMKLDNEAEVRKQIAAAADKDTEIRFRFVPSGNNKMVRHFLDWGGDPKNSTAEDPVQQPST